MPTLFLFSLLKLTVKKKFRSVNVIFDRADVSRGSVQKQENLVDHLLIDRALKAFDLYTFQIKCNVVLCLMYLIA